VRLLFDWAKSKQIMTEEAAIFKAISKFVFNNPVNPRNLLPLCSKLPDMETSTENYIALREIFKMKAKEDAILVYNYVQEVLLDSEFNLSISLDKVEHFCQMIRFMHILQNRPIESLET
jgi:hypothetical protein